MNLVSQSEMNFFGAPNLVKICQRISAATPSAVIDSLQGMRIIALEQSWSVMVRIMLYPPDWGNFVMKSIAIVWNGSECLGVMGIIAGFRGLVLILLS